MPTTPPPAYLRLEGLTKKFGEFVALKSLSLAIQEGEFVSLLGPSGSGKTTTLKLISGQFTPTRGRIWLADTDITNLPAEHRNIGMVFQNYALFPHMTVRNNIAFPLKMQKRSRAEIDRAIARIAAMVEIEGLLERRPQALSGGQQQRVALARALVFEPKLLLMDEPLGALDRRLRQALQHEIVRTCKDAGATVVYVTHDQDEALSMSDRVVLYNQGEIEQVDSPAELYTRPASAFVANFVGDANIFEVAVQTVDGSAGFRLPDGRHVADERAAGQPEGATHQVVLRPENLKPVAAARAEIAGSTVTTVGRILRSSYFGASVMFTLSVTPEWILHGSCKAADFTGPGQDKEAAVQWSFRDCHFVPR